ncbi:hypothetical protein YC2023_029598 [Brassica napus]
MANNHQLLQTFVHSSPGEKIPSSLRKLLSRTNEASLSAVISRLEHERQGLTDGGGERWRRTVVENGGIRRRISAGAIRKPSKRGGLEICGIRSKEKTIGPAPERCLYGPGELETEVSGSSSRFVVGFLCNRASVVSVFPCEEGCCVDELWRLDNALRSRYEEAREEERNYAISQRTSVTWSPRKPHWFSVSHGSHYTLHLKRNKTNSRNKEEEQILCHAVLAANHFMCMGVSKVILANFGAFTLQELKKKPKSSTTSTGDLGIGLEQLQLMSKVKNIASLQLYGEEQASGSSQCQYE